MNGRNSRALTSCARAGPNCEARDGEDRTCKLLQNLRRTPRSAGISEYASKEEEEEEGIYSHTMRVERAFWSPCQQEVVEEKDFT